MSSSTLPRRFKAEPIETTTMSSKNSAQEENSKPVRRFIPELVETTIKTDRKITPEPVETTTKTNRRFAPQPLETTARSNRSNAQPATGRSRRFILEHIETTTSTNRRRGEQDAESHSAIPEVTEKQTPRKFAPQLIETARRSRKLGDIAPAVLPSDKTEATYGNDTHNVKRGRGQLAPPPSPGNTPTVDLTHNLLFLEMERATSPMVMRQLARARTRSHHSFRAPTLEPIESSESEPSRSRSPSTTPSVNSDHSYMYKNTTRMRESGDDRVSEFLLEVAAKAAEKQLHEQVMAAFPNDDYHEPVQHFIGRDTDDSGSFTEEAKRNREVSFNEVNWELIAMQQHREKQEQQQEAEREKKKRREAELNKSDGATNGMWGSVASLMDSSKPREVIGGYQKDGELNCMRKSARPPMLGKDIKFPRCPSPMPARFDSTQGCNATKLAMCYLSEQSQAAEKGEGLWCGGKPQPNEVPSLWSTASSRPPSPGGLWAGCCVGSGTTPPRGPSGLLTPRTEKGNPLETPCPTPSTSLMPPTPPASHADFTCIDEKLAMEVTIEEEFGDDFVTQVYNYLSLGYPAIARNFDEELAKISHVPVMELRQDDHLAKSTGYIRLGEDGNLVNADITEESCTRWRALRIYVQEWARQQPNMSEVSSGGAGIAVRKGSWAL